MMAEDLAINPEEVMDELRTESLVLLRKDVLAAKCSFKSYFLLNDYVPSTFSIISAPRAMLYEFKLIQFNLILVPISHPLHMSQGYQACKPSQIPSLLDIVALNCPCWTSVILVPNQIVTFKIFISI